MVVTSNKAESSEIPSMDSNIERLAQEVERQLTSPQAPRTPLPFTTNTEWKDEGEDDALREMHNMLKSRSLDQLSTTPFPDLSLLWKVPARCGHQKCVFDEKGIQQQLKRLLAVKSPGRQALAYSDAMWESDEVRSWMDSESSSLLMVESSAAQSDCLEDFALKAVENLVNVADDTSAVAYLLNPSSIRSFPTQYKYPGALEVLREISIQILRRGISVPPCNPWEYLAEVVVAMQDAKNSRDWFQFIGRLSAQFRRVDLVIDVQILGAKWPEAKSWPQDIKAMFAQSNSATHLTVMLITACPLCVPALQGEILRLGTLISQRGATRQRLADSLRTSSRERSELTSLETHDIFRTADRQTPGARNPSGAREAKGDETRLAKSRQWLEYDDAPGAEPLGQPSEPTDQQMKALANRLEDVSGRRCNQMSQFMRRSIGLDQAPPNTPITANDYKVAIFCALPLEADAVMATFISHFKITFPRALNDTNAYSLGLIGTHNVVLVHMEGMGKSNAARAATNCKATFHNLKVALVVGICGGVPKTAQNGQVHLGDVIVSSGMVFYDFGRQFPHAFIQKTDESSMPSRHSSEIKALLAKLATSHCRRRCEELTVAYLRALENLDIFRGSYPGESEDKVFTPQYRHKHHDGSCAQCAGPGRAGDSVCDAALKLSCEELGCDEAHLLRRGQADRLATVNDTRVPRPDVKFGKIASGDKVMKSGEERDAVASEMDIIAFEMEGAGAWDTFPGNCLVIKAACDYADSHKSKKWQRYAALTAASFTKALLEEW